MPVLRHSSNVGNTTQKMTQPLIFKILGAVGVLLLLMLIVSLTAFINSNTASENSRKTDNLQNRARLLQQLQLDVVQAQLGIYTPVFNKSLEGNPTASNQLIIGQLLSQPETVATALQTFARFETDYRQHYTQLTDTGFFSPELNSLQVKLVTNYRTSFQQFISDNPEAVNTAKASTQLTNQLLKEISLNIEETNRQVAAALQAAKQNQESTASLIAILALVAVVVSAVVVWFVARTVVQPLGELNQNLTRLLWEQTEHLTDQMNVLQNQINTNNSMLTAARHDLKAPFSSIKGLAELTTLPHTNLEPDVSENLQGIIKMSDSSVEMVSNVLTRRESRLELQEVRLSDLIDRVLQLVDLRHFNVARDIETDRAIFDVGLMEHALLNLVSNARKFSKGGIGVGVRRIPKPGTVDEKEVELWVWNDGATISAGDRAEIFKPGRQTAEGKKAGGHGLGLSIVSSIVERHHGRVVVDSHEKKGTFFRLILPDLPASTLASETVAPAQRQPSSDLMPV